jgi:hypothetical protein
VPAPGVACTWPAPPRGSLRSPCIELVGGAAVAAVAIRGAMRDASTAVSAAAAVAEGVALLFVIGPPGVGKISAAREPAVRAFPRPYITTQRAIYRQTL